MTPPRKTLWSPLQQACFQPRAEKFPSFCWGSRNGMGLAPHPRPHLSIRRTQLLGQLPHTASHWSTCKSGTNRCKLDGCGDMRKMCFFSHFHESRTCTKGGLDSFHPRMNHRRTQLRVLDEKKREMQPAGSQARSVHTPGEPTSTKQSYRPVRGRSRAP